MIRWPPGGELGLLSCFTKWRIAEHARFHGLKRVPASQARLIRQRSRKLLETGRLNGSLRILERKGAPAAVIARGPSRSPRTPNQQTLFFALDPRHRNAALAWLRRILPEISKSSPRYTEIWLSSRDERALGASMPSAGFATRYEILTGDTRLALARLMRSKTPSPDLDHLGLRIHAIATREELGECMRLQRLVALRSGSHG